MLTEEGGKDLKRHCQEQPEVKQEVPARAEAFQQKADTEDFYGDKNLSCTIEGILSKHTHRAAPFLLAGMENRTCMPPCQFGE